MITIPNMAREVEIKSGKILKFMGRLWILVGSLTIIAGVGLTLAGIINSALNTIVAVSLGPYIVVLGCLISAAGSLDIIASR